MGPAEPRKRSAGFEKSGEAKSLQGEGWASRLAPLEVFGNTFTTAGFAAPKAVRCLVGLRGLGEWQSSGKTQRWAPASHGGRSATRAVSWVCWKLFIWVNNVDMGPLLVVETVSFRVPRAPSPDLAASPRFANVRPLPGLGQWRNPARHCCPERDQAQDRHRVELVETHSGLEPAFPPSLSLSV